MNKILFLAQFPPPIHGLSKAVDTLYSSELNEKYAFSKVDITSNTSIITNLLAVLFSNSDLYYFTIAQTKGGNWRDLLFLKLLKLKNKRVLIHLHGGYYRNLIDNDCGEFQRKLNYKAIAKVSGCIVLSKSLTSIFEGMIESDKIYIVPNCADNEFMMSSENLELKLNCVLVQPILHVLYLSNFIETKGYKKVLELALKAREKGNKGIHFNFAGKFYKKEDEMNFISFIESNNLNDIVTYHGIVTGKAKIDLLKQCNIFILLTIYPNEGQPISILEAMGNGLAVITTNHAGIPDIVKNNKNGLVVDKNNIDLDLLSNYMLNCFVNRNYLSEICRNNFSTILNEYTESQYIANMDTVFTKILQE